MPETIDSTKNKGIKFGLDFEKSLLFGNLVSTEVIMFSELLTKN
jgi:hypothetical protein